ncbi:putative neuropeptide Y receptor type 6 [Exaiptasia diaphana]|uniref:G-protein coupled receptors family 1 profile domain-containing protein n=1 Tax=Exaiptasia diaphana TaxID=2652724 RepID=A0A913XA84_EXADI|nr:putative neuropeptide Y receptor type 6 [Exaiptasia diaphana]KXJ26572.1 Cholecystokinin receptor type A [Exaiptasia diaphana]
MSSAGFNNSSSCTNNTCGATNIRRYFYVEPEPLKVFRLIITGIVLFASLVGNTVVIKAILGKRGKPFVYYLVTNLAVGELITTLCTPFLVTYSELGTWIFGDFFCRLLLPLSQTSLTVVTTTIAVISVRRYQVVSGVGLNFPATKRGVWLIIGAIWLYAFAACSPMYVLYKQTTRYTKRVVFCIEADESSWFSVMIQHYYIARIVLIYGIPVFIMILSYGAVTINIKKQVHSIIKNARPRVNSTQSNTRVTDYNLDAHRNSSPPSLHHMIPIQQNVIRAQEEPNTRPEVNVLLDQEGDLTKMFYMIVLIFILFYLPANIFYILEITRSFKWFKSMLIVRSYLYLMMYFTLALHPLCYGTMSRFYAKAFKKLILCKC